MRTFAPQFDWLTESVFGSLCAAFARDPRSKLPLPPIIRRLLFTKLITVSCIALAYKHSTKGTFARFPKKIMRTET